MTATMPQVNAEFGAKPIISFPDGPAPAGLKTVELVEGNGPMVRRGDTVTVNYHGVAWGREDPFDSSFDRHQPASFGIGVGQVIRGWDQSVPGHNVGSRLLVSIPPEYGYGSRGIPQAGIEGNDTLVFVIDIIETR
ncbi:peptidylprolyl isomerase [Bifidobacterium aemilianum]|uniref:Peptidyl-prolyl cis-trans isomerase n=1 Tax=Bifidobacterium aemilianum TaxID=2493120 RepID=A0A366KA57_9BIFI|nr:FKBP-type peptidyl-prolyl cis-trans isomerase [Bifidobacterium aemilianum]RBP98112.1 peptidylprolyl isomerase [Bifidobacterium aemilianum]